MVQESRVKRHTPPPIIHQTKVLICVPPPFAREGRGVGDDRGPRVREESGGVA